MDYDKKEIASWFYSDEHTVEKDLENADIIYACYETGSYEGDWCVVFVEGGQLFIDEGAHCSCNGPDWGPERTSLEDLRKRTRQLDLQAALNKYFGEPTGG